NNIEKRLLERDKHPLPEDLRQAVEWSDSGSETEHKAADVFFFSKIVFAWAENGMCILKGQTKKDEKRNLRTYAFVAKNMLKSKIRHSRNTAKFVLDTLEKSDFVFNRRGVGNPSFFERV